MLSKDGKKELIKLAKQLKVDGDDDNYSSESHAGCTACVVIITKTDIYCANAGDSRAVLSKKGKAKELSVDHKPNTPSELRRIERANGFVEDNRVNGNLAMSRSIGDFEFKDNPLLKP